jgi:hypothetical protein
MAERLVVPLVRYPATPCAKIPRDFTWLPALALFVALIVWLSGVLS